MRDPLKVLDTDASFPMHKELLAAIKQLWVLRGIAVIGTEIVKTYNKLPGGGEDPVPQMVEREIIACFFANNPRFYREGDRLEGTYFVVSSIHHSADGAYVEIEGDMGLRVKLQMVTNDRYK